MARDYAEVAARIGAVCEGEDDRVALMATVACELFHAFDDFDWVGFYRVVGEGHRGPITKELQGAFFAATKGENEKYADWLTYVNG